MAYTLTHSTYRGFYWKEWLFSDRWRCTGLLKGPYHQGIHNARIRPKCRRLNVGLPTFLKIKSFYLFYSKLPSCLASSFPFHTRTYYAVSRQIDTTTLSQQQFSITYSSSSSTIHTTYHHINQKWPKHGSFRSFTLVSKLSDADMSPDLCCFCTAFRLLPPISLRVLAPNGYSTNTIYSMENLLQTRIV